MKKLGVAVVAAALLLAGCAAGTTAEPAPTVTVTAPAETPEAAPEAAPLTAAPEAAPASGDAEYVAAVRERGINLESYTDEQLIAAGQLACDYYRQGQDRMSIRVVEGEEADPVTGIARNSLAIATWAAVIYCPEFDSLQ